HVRHKKGIPDVSNGYKNDRGLAKVFANFTNFNSLTVCNAEII
ncbi:MAG: hypothetical protein ACI88A_003908, partial [Paraglaciecola sp.]